ncbi:MAG: hypothetical protein IIU58_03240 [Clostridia bacterium]|nr:hypothetical protein [Clostridia bacterium]
MEKIYTIPVNEAFDRSAEDKACGCPFCSLYNMLEQNEIDAILGAAMMEPDIRMETNKKGFCKEHFDIMFGYKNRLGLALILESHLGENHAAAFPKGLSSLVSGANNVKKLGEMSHSCYVCDKIEYHFSRMLDTTVLLYAEEEAFRKKFAAQPYFCLPHYARMLEYAKMKLSKKVYPDFEKTARAIEEGYYSELNEDISWFCKKFDYRYENEPWKNSKDAVERAIKFLRSDLHTMKTK